MSLQSVSCIICVPAALDVDTFSCFVSNSSIHPKADGNVETSRSVLVSEFLFYIGYSPKKIYKNFYTDNKIVFLNEFRIILFINDVITKLFNINN